MAKGATRRRKVPGFMRSVLARNVQIMMEREFASEANKVGALARRAGISLSSAQRVLSQQTGASIDTIEALAEVFDVSVYQLLLPALDPGNPQVVKEAAAEEKRMYRAWHRAKLSTPVASETADS